MRTLYQTTEALNVLGPDELLHVGSVYEIPQCTCCIYRKRMSEQF